jgi:hypothetical protein
MIGFESHSKDIPKTMKSKDIQTAVKNKYENGDGPTKIYCDLGEVSYVHHLFFSISMHLKAIHFDFYPIIHKIIDSI